MNLDLTGLMEKIQMQSKSKADFSEGIPVKYPKINGKKFAKVWMGKKVLVTALINCHERQTCKPFIAWVVGFTFRRRGECEYDSEWGRVFVSSGPSTPVVLVRRWPHSKEEDVAVDGIALVTDDIEVEHPSWGDSNYATEHVKKLLSNEMKVWPRDKRGRWIKT